MLLFRLAGQESLPAFPFNLSDREIRHLKFGDLSSMQRYVRLLGAGNFPDSTLRALKLAIFINRVRQAFDRISILKKLFQVFGNRWFFDPDLAGDRLA